MDIVGRLRYNTYGGHTDGSLMHEAAELIEALRRERDKYRKQMQLGFKHLIETECIDDVHITEGYTLVEHLRMQLGRSMQRLNAMTAERDECCRVNKDLEGRLIAPDKAFKLGDLIRKKSGSQWRGRIVGEYSTALTPEGYAVESSEHAGSVQIYPASALEKVE